MPKLTIVRGLPGSGKSTFARQLPGRPMHLEADRFFEVGPNSQYVFDAKLIKVAHEWCYASVVYYLRRGHDVVVSNTFTQAWEMKRYFDIPTLVDSVSIEVVELKTQYGNIHNVPQEKLEQMAARWEVLTLENTAPGIRIRTIDRPPLIHNWKEAGVDMHKGEYWYRCTRCGKEDWIASYGTLEEIDHGECFPADF